MWPAPRFSQPSAPRTRCLPVSRSAVEPPSCSTRTCFPAPILSSAHSPRLASAPCSTEPQPLSKTGALPAPPAEMVSYGAGGLRLFYYAVEKFSNFTLRLQFRIVDVNAHNSGVFIRFPSPTLEFATDELKRRAGLEAAFDPGNPAWKPVIAG